MMTTRYQLSEPSTIRSAMIRQKPGESFEVIGIDGQIMTISTPSPDVDFVNSEPDDKISTPGPKITVTVDKLVPISELSIGSFVEVNCVMRKEPYIVGDRLESPDIAHRDSYIRIRVIRVADGETFFLSPKHMVQPLKLVSAEFTR